ncbi:MAG TPA: VWA domain-containing protein [Alphaproteobacteria bacterium]|nr:VWA domain-containing protein [Alphaproteobacteria bacterium]
MAKPPSTPAGKPTSAAVAAFVKKVQSMPAVRAAGAAAGRLIFAMDATASREPTWDHACRLQGEMFTVTQALGALEIQLVWYRGFGEFEASPFVASSAELVRRMTGVACHAGETQIGRVLEHAIAETRRRKVNAVVFVGDAVEEGVDRLAKLAGDLGLLGTPVFVFHEGGEAVARQCFETIARLSGGAYCPFDAGSADVLRDLLAAVATFAVGGRQALEDFSRKRGGAALQLTHRMR